MKKIYYLFSVMTLFICESQKLFASDTLFVVTDKGNYLFDVSNQIFIPYSENLKRNIFFSTEGLGYYTESQKYKLQYSYEKRKNFEWWSLKILNDSSIHEICNFDTKPKNSGYILYPLTWDKKESSLFLLSTNGDVIENEKGIYEYNVTKQKLSLVISSFSYLKTPLVNKDKSVCYFLRVDIRGHSIISFDLIKKKEKILASGLQVSRLGIINSSLLSNSLSLCATDVEQPELKSPFRPLVSFCVTRMGFDDILFCDNACDYETPLCSELPYCEGHCELGCTDCRDAVDMDVTISNFSNKVLVASADGFVIRSQTTCPLQGMGQGYGFGYHVVIRHGNQDDINAPETLYAHLDTIYVEEGDFVFAGQQIGVLGNSQALDCTGDGILDCDCDSDVNEHLHYEYHNGVSNLYSSGDIFAPIFEDIGGCVPQPNNSYTTNFSGLDIEDIYPSSNAEVYDIEVDCSSQIAFITLVGESCACCESYWVYEDEEYEGDTLVIVVTEEMINLDYLLILRYSSSLCISQTSVSDGPSFLVPENYFSFCLAGCNDFNACNYNSNATHDDGSCHYLCISECGLVDLDHDGIVTTQDLVSFLSLMGSNGPLGDFNQDGNIGVSDMVIMFSFFGEICD